MTRLPIPEKWAEGVDFRQYWRGVPYFPLIGMMIGGLAGLVSLSVSLSGGGMYTGAMGYVLVLAFLTGGLHLDGLADTCDGIFSSRQREKKLAIMRDSRLGTYGGIALIFCIVSKLFAVVELSYHSPLYLLALLTCAPIVGRTAVVLLMYEQRYARDSEGMGSSYIGRMTSSTTVLTLLVGIVLVLTLGNWKALSAMMMSLFVVYGLAFYFSYHLGGQTGDTLGAAIEVGEVVFLLTMIWK